MNSKNVAGYSANEELANTYSHALGIILSVVGLFYLLYVAISSASLSLGISYTVYGLSLLSLYSASTLYHHTKDERLKLKYKKLDHICIYFLIAGSYTPIMLNSLGGTTGMMITVTVWLIAIFGIYYKLFVKNQNKFISTSTYLLMGWLITFFSKELAASMSDIGLDLLMYGGLAYTGGVVFYLMKKVPYTHAIWHLFVLAGSVLHFFSIILA